MKILERHFAVCATIFAVLCSAAAADGPDPARSLALASREMPALGDADTNALPLEAVLRNVLQSNPSLKAARANWEAMKQRVPQARAWEDLRAGFDTVAGRFVSIPPNSFTDQKLMVEQAVPLSGRNRLRGEAAEAEAADSPRLSCLLPECPVSLHVPKRCD